MIIEGSSEAVAKVEVATAFAFLADPHNGRYWFSNADPLERPAQSLATGLSWHLEKTTQTRRMLPLRMLVYQPPERFVWATELGSFATNNIWDVRLQPGPESGTTRLTMTLRLQLGPFGWLSALIFAGRLRRTLAKRANSALDRAREVLEAQQLIAGDARQGQRGKPSRGTRRRHGARGR